MSDLARISIEKQVFSKYFESIYYAISNYSNVHRGSGQFSEVSTFLYEKSREIILEYLNKNKNQYQVLFLTPDRAKHLLDVLDMDRTKVLRSSELGLPLGVVAIVVRKGNLNKSLPFQSGGGTTKLISKEWVVWAKAPDRFEGGTPPIINVIAFARALQLNKKHVKDIFPVIKTPETSINDILYSDDLQSLTGKELLTELRKTLIGKDNFVQTIEGKKSYINFDNSASTPTFEPIWKVYRKSMLLSESMYKVMINEVKKIIFSHLNASPEKYEVLFTSNTTEAINIATKIFKANAKGKKLNVVSSLLEHSSNDLPWREISNTNIKRVKVDKEGLLDYNEMNQLLKPISENKDAEETYKILTVSGASNVLGIYTDLDRISRIAKEQDAKVIIDAAQLIAHAPVNMNEYELDALAFSAHKIYAPFGCGVLVIKKEEIEHYPDFTDSNEENIAGIAALGKALLMLQRIGMENVREEEMILTHHLLKEMRTVPSLEIYGVQGEESKQFPNKIGVIPFNLIKQMSPKVARELAWAQGIGVRYGCHCAHILVKHIHDVSPRLERFQRFMIRFFPKLKLPGVFRVSVGIQNTMEDVEHFIETIKTIGRNGYDSKKVKSFQKDGLKLLKQEAFENVFASFKSQINK